MSTELEDAIRILEWGSTQPEQSASLTPAQCRALLDRINSSTKRSKKETTDR